MVVAVAAATAMMFTWYHFFFLKESSRFKTNLIYLIEETNAKKGITNGLLDAVRVTAKEKKTEYHFMRKS